MKLKKNHTKNSKQIQNNKKNKDHNWNNTKG
jgi:hypothetical protein